MVDVVQKIDLVRINLLLQPQFVLLMLLLDHYNMYFSSKFQEDTNDIRSTTQIITSTLSIHELRLTLKTLVYFSGVCSNLLVYCFPRYYFKELSEFIPHIRLGKVIPEVLIRLLSSNSSHMWISNLFVHI